MRWNTVSEIPAHIFSLFQKIGEDWITHLDQLQQLKQYAEEPSFIRNIQTVKQENKMKLAAFLQKEYGVAVNPASMFDVQVSRLCLSQGVPDVTVNLV